MQQINLNYEKKGTADVTVGKQKICKISSTQKNTQTKMRKNIFQNYQI